MSDRNYLPRTPGKGIEPSEAEMKGRIARFNDLPEDPTAFVDHTDGSRKRRIAWAISPGQSGGPAPVSVPHGFHMLMITATRGKRPPSHSHPYNEVFMCMEGRFGVFWGIDAEDKGARGEPDVILEKFDLVSVPPGTMGTFECLTEEPGVLMTLFDTFGDPNIGVVVPPDIYEKYYKPTEAAFYAAAGKPVGTG